MPPQLWAFSSLTEYWMTSDSPSTGLTTFGNMAAIAEAAPRACKQARAQRGSGGCVRTVALRLVLDLEPEVPGLDRVVAPGQAPLACAKAPVRPARKRKRAGSPQAKRRLAPGKSELLDTDQTFSKAASSSKFSKNSTSPSGCGRAVCV